MTTAPRQSNTSIDWSNPRSVLRAIRSEPLVGLISADKVFRDPVFLDLVKYSTDCALKTNFGPATVLLMLLTNAEHHHRLASWYEARAALSVTFTDGRWSIRPRKEGLPRQVALAEYFPEAQSALSRQQAEEHLARVESRPGVRILVERGVDLMDTKLRLPGSFGSGKRR